MVDVSILSANKRIVFSSGATKQRQEWNCYADYLNEDFVDIPEY